jgi:prepilin-type N-terminal cleavage/methylation domain-containing protein
MKSSTCHPEYVRHTALHSTRARQLRGLTLIEIMVVVGIIGILSAIAYPNYRDYVVRGHLADASNGLSTIRVQMERHFQDNRSYATVGTFTTPCAAAAASRTFGNFVVACQGTPTATAFTLVATGSGPVDGFSFTINETDARATTAVPSGWSTCATRWITRKGMPC